MLGKGVDTRFIKEILDHVRKKGAVNAKRICLKLHI